MNCAKSLVGGSRESLSLLPVVRSGCGVVRQAVGQARISQAHISLALRLTLEFGQLELPLRLLMDCVPREHPVCFS